MPDKKILETVMRTSHTVDELAYELFVIGALIGCR